ncbi:helix-turn-helix transcriptional regulator [Nocardia wallacei]|uniref:helix-turn-helix transcriptional regulator n=1 Tax=Nocardia wallacei TaxID=480035 RepID=UPI003CC7E724
MTRLPGNDAKRNPRKQSASNSQRKPSEKGAPSDEITVDRTIVPIHGGDDPRLPRRRGGLPLPGDRISRRWLTREEAGEYMGVHPRTLANWAAKGHGPRYSKPSSTSCMYRVADLDSYLEAHLVNTEEQPEAA